MSNGGSIGCPAKNEQCGSSGLPRLWEWLWCVVMSKVVIPRVVMIAGHRIRVRLVDGRELDGVYGDWSNDRREIRLARGEAGMVATLRHEMMHAALDLSGVGWCKRYQEEAIIRCMDEIFWPAWERLGL